MFEMTPIGHGQSARVTNLTDSIRRPSAAKAKSNAAASSINPRQYTEII